jgi:hypothetical protein
MPSTPWRRCGALLCLLLTCITSGWTRESDAADFSARHPRGKPGEVKPPQIPTEDFEWNGTFRVPGQREPVVTALTIRGMWQDGYFNLYMQQGSEGGEYWVENLIHQNHLYTITHKWPGLDFPVTGACYKTHDEITVHGLNGILASSQLVGLEQIEGTPMHHFRVSCLSTSQIIILLDGLKVPLTPPIPVSIFSDIYVRPGRSHPFERWLQFGDAVGLSKQHDEWFFFEDQSSHPKNFQLPPQCAVPILLSQGPCSNLADGD